MILRRPSITVLLLVVPLLLAFKAASGRQNGQAPDLSSLSDADLKGVTIRLERTGCFGDCPSYTVTIHGDGRVEYKGDDNVKVKGSRDGKIKLETVRALVAEFGRASFFSMNEPLTGEKCTCSMCTDMPSAITEIVVGKVTHQVDHYYGCRCASKSLFDLETAIDKAANVEQWTGDVSKQGPLATTCFGPRKQ